MTPAHSALKPGVARGGEVARRRMAGRMRAPPTVAAAPTNTAPPPSGLLQAAPAAPAARRRRRHHHPTPPRGILDSFRAEAAQKAEEEEDLQLEACPIECVLEISGVEDDGGLAAFDAALAAAPPAALVVVDFYKTACGACRYIAPGFVKLCKKAGGGEEADVVFLKHNVLDEEGGRTALAVREGVRAVPTFYFYRAGVKLESFPTRDRAVVAEAVNRLAGREVL